MYKPPSGFRKAAFVYYIIILSLFLKALAAFRAGDEDPAAALRHAKRIFAAGAFEKAVCLAALHTGFDAAEKVPDFVPYFHELRVLTPPRGKVAGKHAVDGKYIKYERCDDERPV